MKFNQMLLRKNFSQTNIKEKEKEILFFIRHNIKKNVMILNNLE